jgi:hypothetical protein
VYPDNQPSQHHYRRRAPKRRSSEEAHDLECPEDSVEHTSSPSDETPEDHACGDRPIEYHKQSLLESEALPSVGLFAECLLSGTR